MSAQTDSTQPTGEIVIRTMAMPADANSSGGIFGGWLMAQLDLGGAILARTICRSQVATVAVEAMSFVAPVRVGDTVTCYAKLLKIGRTSMSIHVEAWVQRLADPTQVRVTEGIYTYVALDPTGKPHPVNR